MKPCGRPCPVCSPNLPLALQSPRCRYTTGQRRSLIYAFNKHLLIAWVSAGSKISMALALTELRDRVQKHLKSNYRVWYIQQEA